MNRSGKISSSAREYPSREFARGLNTLAYIARDEPDRSGVEKFLLSYSNSKKPSVQLGAIEALGVLGDPRASAALETFALARKDTREQSTAQRAIEAIENFHRPGDGLSSLRREFLDLQKENRELRKNFDDLQKKIDALETKPADAKKSPPPAKKPKQKSDS